MDKRQGFISLRQIEAVEDYEPHLRRNLPTLSSTTIQA